MSNILITEDEEILIRSLKDNLVAEGFTVDTARNGGEAIERVKQSKPDIILLDLLMPGKDGFYVLEELQKKSKWKVIPVIVLSNLGDENMMKRAMDMGAKDYFVKSQRPIEDVIKKVKECLKK